MDKDWQTKIGDLVRKTYHDQGYTDIVIAIGAINNNKEDDTIHTQVWKPGETATDFDIRLMWFSLNNHLFTEFNNILKQSRNEEEDNDH